MDADLATRCVKAIDLLYVHDLLTRPEAARADARLTRKTAHLVASVEKAHDATTHRNGQDCTEACE